jgi:hypothetical protein
MATTDRKAFAHLVYFTLKQKSADMQIRLIAGCHQYLSDHPGTLHFSAGSRATDYQRAVNDQEFDVALVVVFASEADHEQYQVSERHQQFLAEYSDCWSQVRVFDALV